MIFIDAARFLVAVSVYVTVRCPSVRLSVPRSIKNPGVFSSTTPNFISELGRRLCVHTGDARETSYLFQRISIMLQLFNSPTPIIAATALPRRGRMRQGCVTYRSAPERSGERAASVLWSEEEKDRRRLVVCVFVSSSIFLSFSGPDLRGAHWAVARGPPQKNS